MAAITAAWNELRAGSLPWRSAWTISALIVLLIAIFRWPDLPARLSDAASALLGTLPYILFAVIAIGWLKASQTEGIVAKAFQGSETRMIVLAALFGGLAPFCSCEVIPFVAALLAAGTPVSAVMAFWLASPLMDPPAFAITTGALGIEYAVGKTVAAVSIGLLGGFALRAMMARGAFADPLKPRPSRSCCGGGAPKTPQPKWDFWTDAERRAVFADAALENLLFLVKWLTLAYLLESVMIAYVDAATIGSVVGGTGPVPVLVGALVGIPAYLNGYAAPALVAGLIEQGMTPGAAMSFLVAGAVTCIPAAAAVFALVRRPVFLTYLGFALIGAILSGFVFEAVMGLVA